MSRNRKVLGTPSRSTEVEMLALVRWLTGRYEGTMTHNVSTKWIRNFNQTDFSQDESYTVEWRQSPMPRTGGWPLYDCIVLEISDDADFLLRKKQCLERTRDDSEQGSPSSRHLDSNLSRSLDSSTPLRTLSQNDVRDFIFQSLSQIGNGNNGRFRNSDTENDSSSSQCVKKVGTALLLSNTAYIEAKAASSPALMTMCLVRNAFSKRRLRKSSYAGQKRGDKVKPGLKKYRKMQDVQDFVKSRFQYFSQSQFGAAVNACLGKNVDKVKERQLCDESASEDDEFS